jgi:hypothetical protein
MSNICYSDWVFEGNPSEIQDLYNKLTNDIPENEYTKPIERFDCDLEWLGNVVACFGGDINKIDCWGTYYDVKINENGNLEFSTYTDNNDMAETWAFVCSKYQSLRFFYYSEETASSGVWTNDKEGKYFQAGWNLQETDNHKYYPTKEAVLKRLSELLGKPVLTLENIDDHLDAFNDLQERQDSEIYLRLTEIMLVDEEGEYIGPDMDILQQTN